MNIALGTALLVGAGAADAEVGLESRAIEGAAPTVDGPIDDWSDPGGKPLTLTLFGEPERIGGQGPWGGDTDASLEIGLAHDKEALYLGMRIQDDVSVHGDAPSLAEDHVELWFGVPSAKDKGLRAMGVAVFLMPNAAEVREIKGERVGPVVPGSTAALAGTPGFYEAEARIPWAAILGPKGQRTGLTAAVFLVDRDAPKGPVKNILGSVSLAAKKQPASWPVLTQGDLSASLAAFRKANRFGSNENPQVVMAGDVAGDDTQEQIVVMGRSLVVFGPSFGAPGSYVTRLLPVASGSGVKSFDVVDLTGDGKCEIVLELEQTDGDETTRWIEIYRVSDKTITQVFTADTAVQGPSYSLENRYKLRKADKTPGAVTMTLGQATGPVQTALDGAIPGRNGNPMVVPWTGPKEITYVFNGERFARAEP
ncbi:MAG: sugar-binding protein [Deltaproteobacteria bacterium]|nr:sugar-binding protein [Deltaproteobacteria bacterium]